MVTRVVSSSAQPYTVTVMILVWQKSSLRLAMTAITVGAIMLSSGLWLPLGIAIGVARHVPEWSRCGQELCHCQPTPPPPVCPVCPVAPDECSSDRCDHGQRAARTRLDVTPIQKIRSRCASVFLGGFFMVGVLGTETVVTLPPANDAGRVAGSLVFAVPLPDAEVETPPPRI